MEPKFKNGAGVKLKDGISFSEPHTGLWLTPGEMNEGQKYIVKSSVHNGTGFCYGIVGNEHKVGEDALELWPEPVSHPVDGARKEANERIQQAKNLEFKPKTDGILEQLNTVGEQEVKSEIDPQLFELVKAALTGLCADSEVVDNIAETAILIATRTLNLLREEKNK